MSLSILCPHRRVGSAHRMHRGLVVRGAHPTKSSCTVERSLRGRTASSRKRADKPHAASGGFA